jgi:hypothetical protein
MGLSVLAAAFATITPANSVEPLPYSTTDSPYVEGVDLASSVFDPLDVSNISLVTDEEVIEHFRRCCNWEYEGPWQAAELTMTVKGQTVGPLLVGFHLKGAWGSWVGIDQKPGIKIKVDAFIKNQTVFGIKKLILNNMWQEGSAFNQQLTMRLFRSMNVPASRTGYTHLTINDLNYGLYTLIESLDRASLPRWFPTTKHLYKGGVPNHGADLTPEYEWALQVETGSQTDRSDLTPFLSANVADDWWTEINKVADMQEMVREWVVENISGHWDGYNLNGNNYYLHVDDSGKFSMMPWGVDQTWQGTIGYTDSYKLMGQKCLQTPACTTMWYQAAADATYAIEKLDLAGMANAIKARINPELQAEPWNRRNWSYWDSMWNQSYTIDMIAANAAWPKENIFYNNRAKIELNDSALSALTVSGNTLEIPVADNTLADISLPAGTRSATTVATARQAGALVTVSGNTSLVDGWNNITINVSSPNRKSTQVYVVRAYVPKLITKVVNVVFNAKNQITAASLKTVKSLAALVTSEARESVSLTVAGSSPQRAKRMSSITRILTSAGMPAPASTKLQYDRAIKTLNMKLTITYVA